MSTKKKFPHYINFLVNNKIERSIKINNKHLWFSGRIRAYQAREPGSIPGGCNFLYIFKYNDLYMENKIIVKFIF